MKNVAILVQNLHNGGAERMAANLSIEIAKSCKVYLFVFDASNAIYPYGGKLIDLKVPPLEEASASTRAANVIKRVRRLSFLKNKYQIDCTISHMDGANVVNILSRRNDKVICVYALSACEGSPHRLRDCEHTGCNGRRSGRVHQCVPQIAFTGQSE